MNRLRFALATALLAAFAPCSDSWHTFHASDGSYSISFPRSPRVETKPDTLNNYEVPIEIASQGDVLRRYVAMRWDFSKYRLSETTKTKILKSGLKGLRQRDGYQVYNVDEFKIGGKPGLHIVVRKDHVEQQLYGVFNRSQFVAIAIMALEGTSTDEEAQRFIASFKVR